MIKFKLEHGFFFGKTGPYAVRMTVVDEKTFHSTHSLFAVQGLNRLSQTKLNFLFDALQENFVTNTKAVLDKISSSSKEKSLSELSLENGA